MIKNVLNIVRDYKYSGSEKSNGLVPVNFSQEIDNFTSQSAAELQLIFDKLSELEFQIMEKQSQIVKLPFYATLNSLLVLG